MRGPRGPRGVMGPTGPAGFDGFRGHTGLRGATGVWGTDGKAGPGGEQGKRGPTGARGIRGIFGATGPRGRDTNATYYNLQIERLSFNISYMRTYVGGLTTEIGTILNRLCPGFGEGVCSGFFRAFDIFPVRLAEFQAAAKMTTQSVSSGNGAQAGCNGVHEKAWYGLMAGTGGSFALFLFGLVRLLSALSLRNKQSMLAAADNGPIMLHTM